MKWLDTVRFLFSGGTRSAPTTPTASPSMHHRGDASAKQNPPAALGVSGRGKTEGGRGMTGPAVVLWAYI
ncbi:hypothetical protein SKAU_G00021920 [Synaphobranchus kaupii]|uniref:Uncharacterized protein n=1 Tax=Synaphobranchus kaupii TaxID=118154 RepID=A0A9Q1GDD5_SYNKA|nr:hypothetical protein SKAU_G00021920 [Synaphobranchus kaupii]